jgi:hypothetical protein
MPESVRVDTCAGCGRPVDPDKLYVDALEYESAADFVLHMGDGKPRTRRRFHVEHFRRQIDDCLYVMVDEELPSRIA